VTDYATALCPVTETRDQYIDRLAREYLALDYPDGPPEDFDHEGWRTYVVDALDVALTRAPSRQSLRVRVTPGVRHPGPLPAWWRVDRPWWRNLLVPMTMLARWRWRRARRAWDARITALRPHGWWGANGENHRHPTREHERAEHKRRVLLAEQRFGVPYEGLPIEELRPSLKTRRPAP
jgi:hypothetical protein